MAINANNKNMRIENVGKGVHPKKTPEEEKMTKDPAKEMWDEINKLPPKERLKKTIELTEKDIADTIASREEMGKKKLDEADQSKLQTMEEQYENMGKYIEKQKEELESLKKEFAEQ